MARCRVAVILESIDAEDRAALGAVLAHRDVQSARIAETLRDGDYYISNDTVGRHRRGECKCAREAKR